MANLRTEQEIRNEIASLEQRELELRRKIKESSPKLLIEVTNQKIFRIHLSLHWLRWFLNEK